MSGQIPKVALVHDWLTGMRGGEKVLEVLCEIFPQADLFTLVHVPGSVSKTIESRRIVTSFLQNFPDVERLYRHYLPFMPCAIESLDLSAYDVVVSTSHCVAKGCKPRADALHLCYCHTPMRYVWDQFNQYFGPGRAALHVRLVMNLLRPWLRRWDKKTANRVTSYIANSNYVRSRIQKFYGMSAEVLHPPVDADFYSPDGSQKKSDYYLMVTAFAPYKRVDLAIHSFNQLKKPLKIIGQGQEAQRLKSMAGPNIEFLGWRSNEELRAHYRACKALIFPGVEDFGIVPLEAMACGSPVIAFGEGGAVETVVEGKTGVFFDRQTPDALVQAVERFESMRWDVPAIRSHAEQFSLQKFKQDLRQSLIKAAGNRFDLSTQIS